MRSTEIYPGRKYQCRIWGQVVTCRVIRIGMLRVLVRHSVNDRDTQTTYDRYRWLWPRAFMEEAGGPSC